MKGRFYILTRQTRMWAEDGRRDRFTAWDSKWAQTPRLGDEIDFGIQDGDLVMKATSALRLI
ncbi:hypothetical protein BSZ21_04690 [Bradyrhizobium canariense]|nr:hypothetical protein BSZ21_04690 [Bradyrhizobium canariense]